MADQALLNTNGAAVDERLISELREHLRGELIRPSDDGYDGARTIWNGMIDKHPGLIARCTGTADVISAVRFARESELLVSIRGGGHNVAGSALCDGGLVIDLSLMRGVYIDPIGRTARAQPGPGPQKAGCFGRGSTHEQGQRHLQRQT